MTITTTFVTVLRRFEYLAEKVMYSNHYKAFHVFVAQRIIIKFLVNEDAKPSDILQRLKAHYGESALSKTQDFLMV
jgi:hypothetical protein